MNKVRIEGILKELNIKEENDVISGDVIISTDAHSDHAVSVYVTKETKEGKANTAWKGIQTVMNEYTSIAALMKEGRTLEEATNMATKVRLGGRNGGTLGRNEFYANDELVSRPRISANFFSRIDDDSFEPKARFEVECYFEKIRKEMKDSEETGRLLIDAIIPMYGGVVVPMEFIADGEVAEYLESNYSARKTGEIAGNIVNIAKRTVTKKTGFGEAREDVQVNYTRELVVTGGEEFQYDEDDDKAFSTAQIKVAWAVRESETLPALLKKSQDKNKGDKSGKGNKNDKKGDGFKF